MAFSVTAQKDEFQEFHFLGTLSAVLHNVSMPSVLAPPKGVEKNGLARKGIKSLVISF
jgi:hypothetical protein